MAWGDGIKPEDKIYKKQGIGGSAIIIIILLGIITLLLNQIIFDKKEVRKHKQTMGGYYAEQALKNLNGTVESLVHPKEERQVIYTSDESSNRMVLEIGKIQPTYPQSALNQEHEGFVTYKVDLNQYGIKEEIKLAKSSGYESLDTAALKAIKQSAFTPPNLLVQQASTLYITCGFQDQKAQCKY